jgi:hypothetical protein
MNNHYYDENGVYTGSAPAHAGSLPPANAVRTPPPSRPGFWPVRSGDEWRLVEDHRGEQGRLNGRRAVIVDLGPLPEGWNAPEPPGAVPEGPRFFLTPSGTYHAEGCRYTAGAGEWLDPAALHERKPGASACGSCRPPALQLLYTA